MYPDAPCACIGCQNRPFFTAVRKEGQQIRPLQTSFKADIGQHAQIPDIQLMLEMRLESAVHHVRRRQTVGNRIADEPVCGQRIERPVDSIEMENKAFRRGRFGYRCMEVATAQRVARPNSAAARCPSRWFGPGW